MKSYTWTGLEHGSLEHCTVTPKDEGYFVASQISFDPGDPEAADVVYELHLDRHWNVERILIQSEIGDKSFVGWFKRDADGWKDQNGAIIAPGDVVAVDITATPMTNTLAIRQLKSEPDQAEEIAVLYFDLDAGTVDVRRQRYTKLNETQYRFETIPADFEAVIDVDEDGFVLSYPKLFSREC